MLSRLFGVEDINEDPGDDCFDIIVAAIEESDETDKPYKAHGYQYVEEIVMLPNQTANIEKTSHDQNKDEEILWIKELILKHGDSRPKITEFANTEQRILYKQSSSLRVIQGILYSQSEDHNGIS